MRGKIGSPGVAVKRYYRKLSNLFRNVPFLTGITGRRYGPDGEYPMKINRDSMQI
jgi:hypothetical protein